MEYTWDSETWYGDLELMFALVAQQDSNYQENWDSSNDWSCQGLGSDYILNNNVPLFVDGVHVFGQAPGGQPPTTNPTNPPTTPPVGCQLLGDVNNTGVVDIVDALMVAQYYVGLIQTFTMPTCADVNCDGNVTIVDALIIAQYYVGLLSHFPC